MSSQKVKIMNVTLVNRLFSIVFLFGLSVGVSAGVVEQVELRKGEVKVIPVKDVEQVAVGNDSIIQYKPVSNNELLIIGGNPGRSSLHIWSKGGRTKIFDFVVVSGDVSKDLRLAQLAIKPYKSVTVREREGVLIFDGEINAQDQEMYANMLSHFGTAMTLVRVRQFEVQPIIRLDVKILELSKRATTQLGIRWQQVAAGPAYAVHKAIQVNDRFAIATKDPNDEDITEGILGSIGVSDKGFYNYFGVTSALTSKIEMLAENGDARIIAEPRLSSKSGEDAKFHSGGEFPIPVVDEFGRTVVTFKPYGIELGVKSTVDNDNIINTVVDTTISSIDYAVQINDIPGTRSRSTSTTVDLQSGDTLVISGLFSGQDGKAISKVPFLGDIPIIKYAFRTTDKSIETTELVVVITPYVITPESEANTQLLKKAEQMREYWLDKGLKSSLME